MSRKFNQKDYKWYVLLDGSIESGWEFEQDARDQWKEVKRMNVGSYPIVHVFSKRHLISLGTNPDDNSKWHGGGGLSGALAAGDISYSQKLQNYYEETKRHILVAGDLLGKKKPKVPDAHNSRVFRSIVNRLDRIFQVADEMNLYDIAKHSFNLMNTGLIDIAGGRDKNYTKEALDSARWSATRLMALWIQLEMLNRHLGFVEKMMVIQGTKIF